MQFGYTFIWVDDVKAAVAFYKQVFDLKPRFVTENGAMGYYAELETGATTLAIADTKEAKALFTDGYIPLDPKQPPAAFQLSFVTTEVVATYESALAAGATSVSPPAQQPWGQTIARVRDLNGILVSIATPPTARTT
jgi:uncharacterized glyoxalase superfamily protein PhnB